MQANPTEFIDRESLRHLTDCAYDYQKLRIQVGGRLQSFFMQRLQAKAPDDDSVDAKIFFRRLKVDYELVAQALIAEDKLPTDLVITNEVEQALCKSYMSALESEKQAFKAIEHALEHFPIWTEFLKDVKGISKATAANLVSYIDIYKCKYASSLWKYCELDVASDGRGRGRYKEHLQDVKYTDSKGKEQTKKGITYNPKIRSFLIGVLADNFIKLRSSYRDYYDNYKHRISTNPKHKDKAPGHRHAMAKRYMIKMFLADLYNYWRVLEGLEVHNTFHEDIQGHTHGYQDPASLEIAKMREEAIKQARQFASELRNQ